MTFFLRITSHQKTELPTGADDVEYAMGHLPEYKCTLCGSPTPRDELLAKKISFLTLGSKGKTVKSRTSDWICLKCLASGKDPHWKLDEYESPGMRQADDVKIEAEKRVTARRAAEQVDNEKK